MNESQSAHDNTPIVDELESEDTAECLGVPWITYIVIAVCGVIFAYFNLAEEWPSFETAVATLAPSAVDIWSGSYWGLITTAIVHVGFWHVAFNMWWAKDFGAVLEPTMGRGSYLIFIVVAALVSSCAQLAFSGETGIGFSGVVYAMFGYGLAARNAEPRYQHIVDTTTIKWLLGWLVLCFVLTAMEVWNVGNYAHLGGFLFGYFSGNVFTARTFIMPSLIGLVILTILSGLSMFYMPWSAAWQMRGAIADVLAVAEQAQSGDAEAQFNYAYIQLATGDKLEAISWLRKSVAQRYAPAMNGLAWILATDREERFRNGQEAVRLARRACEEDGWETAAYIDTLAAAYAESEQWEDAVIIQRRAMKQVDEDEQGAARYESRLQKYLKREKVRD